MKANYENWVPKRLIFSSFGASVIAAYFTYAGYKKDMVELTVIFAIVSILFLFATFRLTFMYMAFSYDGKRQLSRRIIDGTAECLGEVKGQILEVGAGSGALSIAVAKKNPDAKVIGVDRWGKEYAAFSKALCEENAKAEGVSNVEFKEGSATSLDFEDEVFDGLVCNYVYSNISGFNKQELILESLRTVKKGGKFAIHDIMTKSKYGDIEKLVDKLRADGYEEVHLIRTDEGKFMSKFEGYFCGLRGSMLLVGTK